MKGIQAMTRWIIQDETHHSIPVRTWHVIAFGGVLVTWITFMGLALRSLS